MLPVVDWKWRPAVSAVVQSPEKVLAARQLDSTANKHPIGGIHGLENVATRTDVVEHPVASRFYRERFPPVDHDLHWASRLVEDDQVALPVEHLLAAGDAADGGGKDQREDEARRLHARCMVDQWREPGKDRLYRFRTV